MMLASYTQYDVVKRENLVLIPDHFRKDYDGFIISMLSAKPHLMPCTYVCLILYTLR